MLDQTVHAKHRGEALELMQDAVGAVNIALFEQRLQAGQIIAEGLLKGFEQRQDALGVPDEFHGPFDGQVNRLWRLAHGRGGQGL